MVNESNSKHDVVAETVAGPVLGRTEGGVHNFRGIPYGAPTGGANRFKPPKPVVPWEGVRDATEFGPTAPQVGHAEMAGTAPEDDEGAARMAAFGAFIHGLAGDEPAQSEDCLVLNIWTNSLESDRSRAVMVWIHGGAFDTGSGSWPMYDGTPLASRDDAVVVTINHRLGPLGFLHLDDLGGDEYAGSGNAGMLDIVQALEWVRDNIANFGGDPSKVLVFGGSGGASKTSTLLGMPSAVGLFNRGALLSGPYVRARTADAATELSRQLLERLDLGVEEVDQLQDVPVEKLLAEAQHLGIAIDAGLASSASPESFMPMQPVVDGTVLPGHPMDPVGSPHGTGVAMMVGSTRDDMRMLMLSMPWFGTLDDEGLRAMAEATFGPLASEALEAYRSVYPDVNPSAIASQFVTDRVMWSGSIDWVERKTAGGGEPVYVYRFDYETPALGGILGATHGGDIPFALNNPSYTPMAGERPEHGEFGEAISEAFVRFAHDGDPNHSGLPKWEPYDVESRKSMILDVESRLEGDLNSPIRQLFEKLRASQ